MGTGDEPPRSGPQIAQRLMNVYEKYLHQFDVAYMRSLVQRLAQMQNGGQPVQNMHNGQGQPPMNQANNGMVNHMPGGLNVQGAQPQPPQARPQMTPLNHLSQMTGINDPAKLNELIQLSMHPAEQLRARGINEGVINMVELHRALLQRFMQAQKNFRNGVKSNAAVVNPHAAAANTIANQRQLMMANNGTLPRISDPMPNSQPGGPVAIPRARPSAEDMQRATVVVHNMHKEFQQRSTFICLSFSFCCIVPDERADTFSTFFFFVLWLAAAAMNFRFIELPEQQRFEYNKTFEQLYRYASDVQDKLPFFAYYFQEDMLRKLFTMVRYLHREVDSLFTLFG